MYIYIYDHHPFRGCKHVGRSKNVSNNFDPFVFFPDGEGYMYVRPLLRQKPCPGRFTLGGVESPQEIRHPVPPSEPPPVRENNWVYVIIQFVDNLSEHQKYIKLF